MFGDNEARVGRGEPDQAREEDGTKEENHFLDSTRINTIIGTAMYIGSLEISARLKTERERTGLSVEQFAALSDVTVEAYRAFESGDLAMPFDYVRLLQYLGCDPTYIHFGERKVSFWDDPRMPKKADLLGSFYEAHVEHHFRAFPLLGEVAA